MKKHLLAVAVATAVTAPAMAQNVTVYGILDAAAAQTDNGAFNQFTVQSGYHSSSRLGFQGSEDLGGGMKALFKLEGRLSFDSNGSLGTSTVVSAGATTTTGMGVFNRDAYVGLSGGFGEINVGTMETEASRQQTNATGSNIGLATAAFGSSFDSVTGDRVPNSIRYISPNISGLQVTVGGFQGEYNSVAASSSASSYNGAQFAAVFSSGPLTVRVGQTERQAALAATSTTRQKATVMGALYNFSANTAVGISSYKVNPGSTASDNRSALTVTARQELGNGMRVVGSYSTLEEQAGGTAYSASSTDVAKASAVYVGIIKDLSKRTSIYAMTGKMNNDSNGRFVLNTGATLTAGDVDQSNYAVGIRHSF